MKTSVTLNSVDRYLFGIRVKHRTQPDMLCLSNLQQAYNIAAKENGWHEREINKILSIKEAPENIERIYYVLKERGLINLDFHLFMEECENKTFIKVMKNLGLYKMFGKGEDRIVFAQPDVFVLTAMELNPMLYAKVVCWLTDGLIYNRIGVGDENNQLMARIRYIWNPDASYYKHVQRGLNYIIFGKHETGIRNQASSDDLSKMEKIQNNYAYLIDTGFLKNPEDLLTAMRNDYMAKHMATKKRFKIENK